ncbi:MAG: polysaccharide deacetylase family protein [Methylocystis sp.]
MIRLKSICHAALVAAFVSGPAAADPAACGSDKLGTSREIAIDGSEGLALGLQSYPHTLALADHEVVLTFDDGPAPTTPQVLTALKEQCVHATFFVIGHNASANPELVKREVEEGHSVGYHSNTHPARTLRLMTPEAAKADIEAGIAAVDKAAYGDAGAKPRAPFFRFPGFADSPALLDYLRGRGMTVFGSDLWASDWRTMTPQAELALVMGRLEQAGRGIILFHDSKASTAKMLPDFLRALKAKGFKVAHMVAGAGPTPVEKAGPGWKSTTEPIIAKTLGGKGPASEHGDP